MSNKTNAFEPVSIVIPMRDASTTIVKALASLEQQVYPIKEVIVLDDGSRDTSNTVVTQYKKRSKLPIILITRKKNFGLGSTLNLGVKKSKAPLVVLMHSDCYLPTKNELTKLTDPLRIDPTCLATFSTIDLPMSVWDSYSFWEKCLFSRYAGKGYAGPATKFDCIRRSVYLKVRGFDTVNFSVGGEDMDFAQKICALGAFVLSSARATHLHYLGEEYSFSTFLRKKRQYSMIYGRLLRKRPQLFLGKSIILLAKPFLSILPFLPFMLAPGIFIIVIYSFFSTQKMFVTKSTLSDVRIIILPFVNIFLIYYETFWFIESYLFGESTVL